MEVNDIITIISTLGFPIGACIWMAYFQNTTLQKLTDVMQKNTEALKELCIRLEGKTDGN